MTLEQCYRSAIKLYDDPPEPWSVIEAVEAHRMHWRPHRVHTVLLAESHVFTDEHVEMQPHCSIEPNNTPSGFARFVYCLGYGEADYVGQDLVPNDGTHQYWKLLSSSVEPPSEESFAPFLKTHNRDFSKRLGSKYELLTRLKQDGVWLVDASILALYVPRKKKPSPRMREKIIECCWNSYIRDQIQKANPQSVVVIGKGVYKALQGKLAELEQNGIKVDCVPQPQGCRTKAAIKAMHHAIFDSCEKARAAKNSIRDSTP